MVREHHSGALGLKVSVDAHSGFCNGVVRAIREAERHLRLNVPLYALGAIVHNNEELQRLEAMGLHTIDPKELSSIQGKTLVIRAHGEPPSTYATAHAQHLSIIDCTCPVVLRLQKDIKKEYARIAPLHGRIFIFGKRGHAEVNGLIGQVGGDALIIEHPDQVGQLDYSLPISIFAQTTQDPESFHCLCNDIQTNFLQHGMDPAHCFFVHHTICKQVAERKPFLQQFAQQHHTIIFVCGKESSNGKMLFETCTTANPRSYRVENSGNLSANWFSALTSVGVCGATSTPKWLMEEVALAIQKL
ncbi:MAG: 4-hydroxy-3-methylbut-2-enyl diphosphate reductase [Prevotellaceae bacterium]|jgi:4-hydroxy-3-methylbut-2-enyl diphosphate reductase|nr:4-hydroxy-3-methylbut-2-enyl diphosphate reductase [Prevotellaceae bacterium]